jgi:restriction system protein
MASVTVHSRFPKAIELGVLDAKWSVNYDRILRYSVDLTHKELNLYRVLSAPDIFMLQSKVDALVAGWDERFEVLKHKRAVQSGKETADDMTAVATKQQARLQTILKDTLDRNDAVDWNALKDRTPYQMPKRFPEGKPTSSPTPAPVYNEPKVTFFDRVFGKKATLLASAKEKHHHATMVWSQTEEDRQRQLADAVAIWERRQAAFWAEEKEKEAAHYAEQAASHAKVDAFRQQVKLGDAEAIVEQISLVLDKSDYDGMFEKTYTLQYRPEDKTLLLSYDLPGPDDLPQVKAVKFVKATGELQETKISEKEKKSNFDSVVFQICLRTVHEIFEADEDLNIENVLFNGMVNFIDSATGRDTRSCILSLIVSRSKFMDIDLGRVDPKTCFKSLKGVSASTLATLTPISPIIEFDRDDKRFVAATNIASDLTETTNLASMSWEDFEHLVRELFEKEFSSRGGEVKVTRASKDGGVDAVAFDPDPISGGKIVIQAKRYTRTVDVSAVRDLYGTVMNEGASKGILVTTADYGPDAYSFANGKPLTLLSGANLLHLLERHGYRAHIDIRSARMSL